MLSLALAVYAYANKRRLLLYGNVAILAVIVLFTGFWAYDAKIPMDSVEMNINNVRFWIGEEPHWILGGPANVSSILFNMTVYNPTSRDIPAFHSENYDIRINDKRIGSPEIMFIYVWLQSPLKAHSAVGTEMWLRLEQSRTNPDVWALLLARNFTFTVSGILVTRYYWGGVPSSLEEGLARQYSLVWAAKPYSVSYTYTE